MDAIGDRVLRMAFRDALVGQAVQLGVPFQQAVALVKRLEAAGVFAKQAATLESLLDSLVREAVNNHAFAVVLVEQAKAEAADAEARRAGIRALNPPLVLTAMN